MLFLDFCKTINLFNIHFIKGVYVLKVIVNYPSDENGIALFEERFAEFKSKVIIELIRKMKIDDLSKRKILNGLIEKVNELEKNEKF